MMITNQIPAIVLYNEQAAISTPNFYGNTPIALFKNTVIHFPLIPKATKITQVQIRLGTYCRNNDCHITLQLNEACYQFSAQGLIDNEYTNFALPMPYHCEAEQPINVKLFSEDADDNNVVALWCTEKPAGLVNPWHIPPLPATHAPQVSIVIPIFNQVLYTYNCLLTIQACDPEISKEIILVNNASQDQTSELLSRLPEGFKVIHNRENQGFVVACRQGASQAAGEFILFLNNDTQVRPDYLKALINCFQADAKVGIAGSKLIYPDGYLQEAGGIVFNDASGWNYGRMQDPTAPKYNQTREVDYCSGASLMIRQGLWHYVGGFDPIYAPAYYEDTDLCFAVRQSGYKVVYCPQSEVIHHEGKTAGTDINKGYKAYQQINKDKFYQKWKVALQEHYPPATAPDTAALRLKTKNYQLQIEKEIANFQSVENVHELPDIFHYWSNKYLLPLAQQFGMNGVWDLYLNYMEKVCRQFPEINCEFISIGAGNADTEVELVKQLHQRQITNFKMECLDLNPHMLERGQSLAEKANLGDYFTFTCSDINSWQPEKNYHIVIANQALHHFVELEILFDKIYEVLHPQGYFLTHDMIGRNGHQRWPEALAIFNQLWAELPTHYKYNHLLQRVEIEYENWDCSVESFEGIRAQDILPLLVQKFGFDLFLAYGNVIDIFVDRCFGHNFNADNPDDRAFIDKVHEIDQTAIESGEIKPTHLSAALVKDKSHQPKIYKHLTPEFCIRWPD